MYRVTVAWSIEELEPVEPVEVIDAEFTELPTWADPELADRLSDLAAWECLAVLLG